MSNYYDPDGKPITMADWAQSFEDWRKRIVGLTHIGSIRVSTVWLGLDHSYGEGPPLIFETMPHDEVKDEWMDQHMRRYSTIEQARAGHLEVVLELAEARSAA